MPPTSTPKLFKLVLIVVAAALLLLPAAGCASASRTNPRAHAAQAPESPEQRAQRQAQREQALEEVGHLVLLAREQARLGLIPEARQSYEQAIALLAPFAAEDEHLTAKLRALDAEQERRLTAASERATRFAVAAAEEEAAAEGDESLAVLEAPEPELDPAHVKEVEGAAESVTPDYPVVVNDRVLAWLEVYQKGGKLGEWFENSLLRSGRYEKEFRGIFAEEGLPQDLIYLAHVESAFKTSAYSRARARGIFQFISATGRRYGLRVDWWVDERGEPVKSCRAAAAYLRDLYAEFGDWKLALAAYNGGEGRVRRAIRRAGTKDFWELSRRHFFRRETRNYVPAILAATLIAKDPARFGYRDLTKEPPEQYEIVKVPDQADIEVLARAAGTDAGTLRRLNPALRRGQTPPHYANYPLKVPVGHAAGFSEKLAQIPRKQWIVKQLHRVRRGDTLSDIARRYGTSVRAIQLANNMGRRTLLSVGRVLEIPRGPMGRGSYRSAPMRADGKGRYKVRRGDSLARIARRFGVSVGQLQAWNGLGRSTRIYAGQRLRVGAATATAVASHKPSASSPKGTYRVRRGDTLWEISRRFGVSMTALMRANSLSKRSVLSLGQRLVIPGASRADAKGARSRPASTSGGPVHVVRRGESLYKIARRYGLSVDTLCRMNNIAPSSVIHPGDRLTIQ